MVFYYIKGSLYANPKGLMYKLTREGNWVRDAEYDLIFFNDDYDYEIIPIDTFPRVKELVSEVAKVFANDVDKAGNHYLQHLIKVAVGAYNLAIAEGQPEQVVENCFIVGFVHDLKEDHPREAKHLVKEYLSTEMEKSLDRVTRKPLEPYSVYVSRCKDDPVARLVKIADLKHNLLDRGAGVPNRVKYETALQALKAI